MTVLQTEYLMDNNPRWHKFKTRLTHSGVDIVIFSVCPNTVSEGQRALFGVFHNDTNHKDSAFWPNEPSKVSGSLHHHAS